MLNAGERGQTSAELPVPKRSSEPQASGKLMQRDYYSALAKMITPSARDKPRLRSMIYDLARARLRRELGEEAGEFRDTDGAWESRELEAAIERIEADFSGNISETARPATNAITSIADSAVEIIPPARHSAPPLWEARREFTKQPAARSAATLPVLLSLAGAAILGITIYIAFEHVVYEQLPTQQLPIQVRTGEKVAHKIPNRPPEIPIPVDYGVYALANGQLTELEPLPVKVSDRTLAIPGIISTASKSKLPNGRIRFVVFKRELVNNAPEKIVVRALAEAGTSALNRGAETAATSGAGDPPAFRNISYEMKVAPVDGNPAMIVVRSANPDFSFPAGRYALILRNLAYDFSVDRPPTD